MNQGKYSAGFRMLQRSLSLYLPEPFGEIWVVAETGHFLGITEDPKTSMHQCRSV